MDVINVTPDSFYISPYIGSRRVGNGTKVERNPITTEQYIPLQGENARPVQMFAVAKNRILVDDEAIRVTLVISKVVVSLAGETFRVPKFRMYLCFL